MSFQFSQLPSTAARARLLFPAAVLLALVGPTTSARADDAPVVVPGAPNLQLSPPPPEAAPPPPSAPSPPATSGGDAEPAPGEPAPRVPSSGAPIVSDSPARGGRHHLAFGARFAYRLGDAGQAISPAAGYGVVGSYDFTYARVADALELAAGVDFSSDRFATSEQGTTTSDGGDGNTPVSVSYGSTRVVSENNFIATQTFAFPAGPVRPFATLGVGAGIGSFETVDPRLKRSDQTTGSETDTHFLARGTLGLDVTVAGSWGVRLRGDYTAVRRAAPFVTGIGQTLPLFGDLLDIDVQAVYRF